MDTNRRKSASLFYNFIGLGIIPNFGITEDDRAVILGLYPITRTWSINTGAATTWSVQNVASTTWTDQ